MKSLLHSGIWVLAFAIAAGAGAWAPPEIPNLSGTWKLSVAKSDFSHATGLSTSTLKIDHQEPKLRVRTSLVDQLGEHSESYRFTTDGKTNSNTMNGFLTETSSVWDGDRLVFDVRIGTSFGYNERWSLSPDGKTLTIKRHTILPRGEITEEFVFDKQ